MSIDISLFKQAKEKIDQAKSILITSHKSPDGDSVGCSVGLYQYLKKLNKTVQICHPDNAPHFLTWIKGSEDIISFENDPNKVRDCFLKTDLIFCLDYNASYRLCSDMESLLDDSNANKILIDHHPNPSINAVVSISDVSRSSTSELICELINSLGGVPLIDYLISEPLYAGMITDTGSFRYPSVSSRTHEIVSLLMKSGLDHSLVHSKIYDTNSIDRLKLRSFAVCNKMEIHDHYPLGIISLTNEELERYNFQKGDTEGLVNVILSVEGVKIGVILIEKGGCVKMSFRSKEQYYVNEFANKYFNGGGHKYAAGGMSELSVNDTLIKLKSLISELF